MEVQTWWADARTRLAETRCKVCRTATLYEGFNLPYGSLNRDTSGMKEPPRTCGMLACLVVADPETWKC